jgi:tetratricopeptide (TPR) repeat protein
MKKLLLLLLAVVSLHPAAAVGAPHRPAVVKEYDRVFTTYPYSDPDPVPQMSKFYPYFRYDGFTDQPVQKKWKVVELSNDYLQLLILPEIGGKVWAAIEKSTGRPFIYFNHVIKFRDVSMRGPWTSGGIEANYGIMGHTPNCFSPVDYQARRNPDGSASCVIGVLDLLTRSSWHLEINLAADAACFSTRSFWHNASGADQPYYTWMNAGIKASGNLQFINPGTHYLGHDGTLNAWPINPMNGHDLSWYEQNNFSSYKSYHVVGHLAEFFGGYWHDDDFGMAHCSAYADKPGRKIWIWGLSREGMIWENLLTDTDGQYVEVQSGRLFNQGDERSSLTPFKHKEFAPYATDTWTEYWQPVKGTKGFVSASPWGAMNVNQEKGRLVIRLSPTRPLQDKLEVSDGNRLIYVKDLKLQPMQPVQETVPLAVPAKQLRVCVGGDKLEYSADGDDDLSRPMQAPADFNWKSAYGLYLKGKESARQRLYIEAEEEFQFCLKTDPNFLPALVEMAELANRRGDYTQARDCARKALSIDTYDPGANYQFGRASVGLGRSADAKDAFSLAALAAGWHSAACVELAKAFLREKQYARALACAGESLESNGRNLDALQLRACVYRLQGDTHRAAASLKALLEIDPLNHFSRFENYLLGKGQRKQFTGLIRNELPHETYLELAAWYRNTGLNADADKVLELAPPTAEVLYWRAYWRRDRALLALAEAASPAFVFPFRAEAIPVFEWAGKQDGAWQPKYFLALIRLFQGEMAPARELLTACGEEPRFGPFYAARAQVCEETAARDLQRAAQLDPGQWRYGAMLTKHYLKQDDSAAALAVTTEFVERFPSNGILALLHAKTLLANARCQAAADLLTGLNLLPGEGSTEAHALFREALLMLAVQRMRTGAFDESLRLIQTARQWPEHLGAGKPYPQDVDERLEDWLACQCYVRQKNQPQAQQALDRVLAFQPGSPHNGVGGIIRALALNESGRGNEAKRLLTDWQRAEPSNLLAKWGGEVVARHASPLPADIQNSECRILAAWRNGSDVP